jgi:hypothetical protein
MLCWEPRVLNVVASRTHGGARTTRTLHGTASHKHIIPGCANSSTNLSFNLTSSSSYSPGEAKYPLLPPSYPNISLPLDNTLQTMNSSMTTGVGPRRRTDLAHTRVGARTRVPSMHWLFRTNIPRKRSSYMHLDPQKRNFFGMGEIFGVLTNVSLPSLPSFTYR